MLRLTDYSVDIKLLTHALSTLNTEQFKLSLNMPSGDFFYDPWIIKPEFKNTVWEDILDSLPYNKGEARIITLNPKSAYCSHADADDRWHLNLQSENGFICDLDNDAMHKLLPDGLWYDMDAGRRHTAANFGSIDRIQLVVRQLFKKNMLIDPVAIKIVTRVDVADFRYQFDNTISPWLNNANKKGIITDFKFINSEVSFNVERASLETLKAVLPNIFEIVQ